MEYLGKTKLRDIYYISVNDIKDLNINELPDQNWLAFVFSDIRDKQLIKKIAEGCVEKNFLYLCSSGNSDELIHAIFDEVIIDNVYNIKNSKIDKDIMTAGSKNFENEFWFAIMVAYHPYKSIDSVVCIDIGLNKKEEIKELIKKIDTNWVPSDHE